VPLNKQSFLYNIEVFSIAGLSNIEHTLAISTGKNDMVVFDYATYL
jgi:hypothetical protein